MVKKSQDDANSPSEDEGTQENNTNGKRPHPEIDTEPKKKRIKNLYRQPTTAELNHLNETENLFNSNLFRLQINEVLQEVKVKEKTIKKFQTWYEKLKQHLKTIPEKDVVYDLSERILQKELKVKIPIHERLDETKIAFQFHKWQNIDIVGSYNLECAINSKMCVDIAMTIPSISFTKNDSLNYRYHKKRTVYLAIVASHLSKSDIVTDLQYSLDNGCESKPILEFRPDGKLGSYISVRLRLACDEDSFKLARYSPGRNNLRETWFFSESENENTSDVDLPTPFYNASVLQDLTHSVNHKFLQEVFENGDNLKQAVVLLKIWLRQRNLDVSGHVANMLIAYLVQNRRINNIMSSYQIVRNVWIYISSSEWDMKGISLFKGEANDTPPMQEFLSSFPVVFLDKTGYYNICWRMTKGTYAALKRESSIAVKMLDNGNINSFIPLFMTTQKFCLQFDHILRFKETSTVKEAIYNRINRDDKINYGLDSDHLITNKLHEIFSRGVGNRVELILPSKSAPFSWPVKDSWKKAQKRRNEELSFGFRLDAEEAMNTIEKGPPANLPEAESFRTFWGDKSELRRFQDGSITETCVWEGDTLAERRLVVKQIVCYLLKLKFGIDSEVFYIADQLDSVLARKEYQTDFDYGTGEEATVKLVQAFDSLRKDLRNLTDLPLHINSVYGTSPVFSYADPLPPLSHASPDTNEHWYREKCCLIKDGQKRGKFHIKLPKYIRTSHAVIEFGHSGKWPGNLEAFRRLKAAFHVQIAESLVNQFSLTTHAYPDHIDVMKEGFVFRLEIAHQKEINLMRRSVEKGVVKYRETEESLEAQCRLVLLPRLRGALHGLHQSHPSYGPATALVKRWLSSHMLDSWHFPHVVLELLVAYSFVRPEPYTPPAQPMTAFLSVLTLLASTDWNVQPLILNFNGQLKREEIIELESKFTESRSTLPPLYIATPYDLEASSVWSVGAPTHNVLARVRILACTALKYLEDSLMGDMLDNVLGVFVPSMSGYDALIHLDSRYVPDHAEMVTKKPLLHRTETSDDKLIPVVDFNPVQKYLRELRMAYDEFALFFHDMYGGDVIAVLWKPHVKEELDFQVLRSNGVKPVSSKDSNKCTVNIEAIIEDFKILGEGLVADITIC